MAAYYQLLASHALTKVGSKGWEFATPLLLLQFGPGGNSLFAPTLFGLTVFALKFVLGPIAGRWIDRAQRMHVVRVGIALQAAGVLGAIAVLGLLRVLVGDEEQTSMPWHLLLAITACGVLEALGALISSVAVKKDWVPAIWAPTDPTLTAVNANMANIDLLAEIAGPLAAGAALQVLGNVSGFVVVGVANVVTFGLELLLLRAVYVSNAQLAAIKPVPPAGEPADKGGFGGLLNAWPVFAAHPSGIPLLVVSYGLLYFTVLSPHGVILTAYLQTRHLSPPALAAFRAAGALSGVAGMAFFRIATARVGLRNLASGHLWLLALSVLAAAVSFGATHVHSAEPHADGLTTPMLLFLALVVVSRFGLYGFDLAVLQLQQVHVDEAYRGSVGAIESSICSLGTASLFVATLLTSSPDVHSFDFLVYASVSFVSSAALVYTLWVMLFHEHEHAHPLFEQHEGSAFPGAVHKHTSQQQRDLEESTTRSHVHLHFHPPWQHTLDHLIGKADHEEHQHDYHRHG